MRLILGLQGLLVACSLCFVNGKHPENMWKNQGARGEKLEFSPPEGDPSPGLYQRTCYHYYGHVGPRDGKEWAQVKCNAPFDKVCIMLKGDAEIAPYVFKDSYVRGCHWRCPCPETQPWEEWYMADGIGDEEWRLQHAVKRHWEKKCFLQHPPREYAVASTALPFTQVSTKLVTQTKLAKTLNQRSLRRLKSSTPQH